MRADCSKEINGDVKPCFAILVPQLEEKLKAKHMAIPPNMATNLPNSNPRKAAVGSNKEFLKPESTLTYIPRGRKARSKEATNTVYRRALYVSKESFPLRTREQLEIGTWTILSLYSQAMHGGRALFYIPH